MTPHHRIPLCLVLGWLLVTMAMWMLAFYHEPEGAPAWVQIAQAVCFGTDESGLPSSGGWLLLVAAPLSLLAAILIAFGGELRRAVTVLGSTGSGRALVTIGIVAVLVEASWVSASISGRLGSGLGNEVRSDDLPAGYPRTRDPAPDFDLVDQHGQRVSLRSLNQRPAILTFAFAHCRSVCPLLIREARSAVEGLPEGSAELLVVTLDPWRDRPSGLPELAAAWKLPANGRVLSGEVSEVERVLDAYQVPRERNDRSGDVVHPAYVVVIDPEGFIAYRFNNPSQRWLEEAIRRLEGRGP